MQRIAAKAVLVLAAALLLGAAWLWLSAREDADDKANREIGAVQTREDQLREVIERTEEGNATREAIKQAGPAGDALRFDQCVRTARTPASCKRLMPRGKAD